ncbi:MAG: UDP-N-acetylmuramoyl-L-alanyl-D-glutamate--2,6-diaminopimelate ligase [Sulfuriflexus sp.]|nr:UDP-N-acetylmuramoyl-L-alanyl-D-glutamate--2,6-diaminopimelate ligase [Sulfuriflexus sp.]
MMAAEKLTTLGYPLYELLDGFVVADCVIDSQCEVAGLSLDSRTVEEGFLFIACHGTQQHGLAFAEKAIQRGAIAIAYEKEFTGQTDLSKYLSALESKNIPLIEIDELTVKVGFIADRFYGKPSRALKLTGITGTNGKTSCSHYLASLFSESATVAVMGTLGNGLYHALEPATHTTPDAITTHGFLADMRDRGASEVVMEVSSHGLAQGRVNGVRFDTAIFTNLSRDHLDYHNDMASYGQAKKKLMTMPGLRYAVVNADDEFGREILQTLPDTVQSIAFSLSDAMNADASVLRSSLMHLGCVQGSDLQFNDKGLSMHVSSPWGDIVIKCELYGRFNAENVLAVLSAALLNGMRLDDAAKGIEKLSSVAGRMQRVAGTAKQATVIVDYAHTPDALQQVLEAVRSHSEKKIWCVFGCGGDRDTGKRPLMGKIADEYADEIILTNDNPRSESADEIIQQIRSAITREKHLHIEQDRAVAITYALTHAKRGDVVLIAGKGHEDYQLIGDERLAFSDVDTARNILEELS